MASRPDFDQALVFWLNLLRSREISDNLRWCFRENLCLEALTSAGEFQISFQTTEPSVTLDDVRRTYKKTAFLPPTESHPLVFASLIHAETYTLCTLLGDEYQCDEDVYVQTWDLYFCATQPYEFSEELTDQEQWSRRLTAERQRKQLSGLDYVLIKNS